MSVIERIRQIKEENQRKVTEAETAKAVKVRQDLDRAKAIFEESSIERLLQELKVQIPNVRLRAEDRSISLMWGTEQSGMYIDIRADVGSNTLIISGREDFVFKKSQFKNTDEIETALARVFLNPHTYDSSWSIN